MDIQGKEQMVAEVRSYMQKEFKTQSKAAAHFGVTQASISQIVNGHRMPSEAIMKAAGLKWSVVTPQKLTKPTMTARQAEIFRFIQQFLRTQGMPPTRAEIAQFFGFKSANAAQDHLMALAKKGYISMGVGLARSILVLP